MTNGNEAALPGRGLHYTERLKLEQLDHTVRKLEVDVGGHLKECSLQNSMIWHEIRGLRRVVWVAVISSFGGMLTVIGFLFKLQMHW